MIRLRNRKGNYIEIAEEDKPIIVEIGDVDGNLAMVLMEISDNHIKQITAQDQEAKKYSETFGVPFIADILSIPEHKK